MQRIERFPAKWRPVRVKKTRQIKNLELRSDSIGTENALEAHSVDAPPPELNASVLLSYLVDVQFTLLAISVVWTAWLWRFNRGRARQVAILVAVNLAVNLIFFMTHPIFTPYYIIPIDMLSLWTLLFATLDLRGERAAESAAFPQPANA